MEGLRYKKLSLLVHQAGARVPKCKHTFENKFPYLNDGQLAILCVLFLRGQQTAGELRQRTERMHPFADMDRVQTVLDELANYEPYPPIKLIPAGGGRRVATYIHLFCGDAVPENVPSKPVAEATASPSWREEMEVEIDNLKADVAGLRAELDELKTNLGA